MVTLAHKRTNGEALEGWRSPLRRVADCWGLTPGIQAPHEEILVRTSDGVALRCSYLPGPSAPAGPAIVVAPGFAGHRTKPAYALLAERLARTAAVLAVDLRGHGGSAGRCSFGVREVADVTAAAAELRRRGHRWVAAVGASMGATAVLRAAGLVEPAPFDAVCSISAPAVWARPAELGVRGTTLWTRRGPDGTPAMRSIDRTIAVRWYRVLVGAVVHVRIGENPWRAPVLVEPPVAVVGAIAPVPLLLVHGEDDHFFPPAQAHLLAAAAGEPTALWIEPAGFGHAEDGLRLPFADRLARAVAQVAADGRWPDR